MVKQTLHDSNRYPFLNLTQIVLDNKDNMDDMDNVDGDISIRKQDTQFELPGRSRADNWKGTEQLDVWWWW